MRSTPLETVMQKPLGRFDETYVSTMSFAADAAPRTDLQKGIYAVYPHPKVATLTYDGFSPKLQKHIYGLAPQRMSRGLNRWVKQRR